MDYPTYQQHVLARASTAFHGDTVQARDLHDVLKNFVDAGNRLDEVKKALMYGRAFRNSYDSGSDLNVSQMVGELDEREQGIVHAALGFATEGVELIECLFARFFEALPFDDVNLQEEFGDGEWYRALGLYHVGQLHEDNLAQNDAKLEKRYGPVEDGFQYKAANERDLEGERAILEAQKAECAHTMTLVNPERLPLRYGSAEVLVCADCGMWRQNRPGFGDKDWQPANTLEAAMQQDEEE